MNEEHRNNIIHYASLVNLARVDGEPTAEEFDILHRFSNKLEVTENEVQDVWDYPERFKIEKLKSRTQRLKYIFDFFSIIYADNVLEENEYVLTKGYISLLGFDSEKTDLIMNKTIGFFERYLHVDDYERMIFGA